MSLGDRVQSVPTKHGMSLIMSSHLSEEGTTLINYGTKLFDRLLVRLQSVVGSRERVIAYRQIERVA